MRIIVRYASGMCVAEVEGKPHLHGSGRTLEEAIGRLVYSNQKTFGVVVESDAVSA